MSSIKYTTFLKLAELGLNGEKKPLINFLQKTAVEEINNKRHSSYKAILDLLDKHSSKGNVLLPSSGSEKSVKNKTASSGLDIWVSLMMQHRLNQLIKLIKINKVDNFNNINKLLLYGPPGTGKTTLGFYIAQKLNRSICYVKVTDVVSSKLGETMKNLTKIFEEKEEEIIFIDEFDAFAKTRDDNNDVGELKRVVNSLIQILDFYAKDKIVIVATNLIDTIDPAILRRFSFKISIDVLKKEEKKDFFNFLLKKEKEKNLKIKLNKKETSFLLEVFDLLNLNTVDDIKSLFEKAKMFSMIGNYKFLVVENFVEAIFFDDYFKKIKEIKKNNHFLLKEICKYMEKIGYSKSRISSLLNIHRNSYKNI